MLVMNDEAKVYNAETGLVIVEVEIELSHVSSLPLRLSLHPAKHNV